MTWPLLRRRHVTVQAGEDWDALVARAVDEAGCGIEALSGIPGSVGATPIQNVGAYGQEVSADHRPRSDVYDRTTGPCGPSRLADCGFGYRTSRFKQLAPRYAVLSVAFQFTHGDLGLPIAYAQLAEALGVEVGARGAVRRRPRGRTRPAALQGHGARPRRPRHVERRLVLHQSGARRRCCRVPARRGAAVSRSRTAGSRRARLGSSSTPAIGVGSRAPRARCALSTKHSLALTNRGGATTSELLDLARELRDGVRARFGITLEPEPTLIGCDAAVSRTFSEFGCGITR